MRTNNNRVPKIMLNYRINRRRSSGIPLNTLLDEAERGLSRPDTCRIMMLMMMVVIM